MRLAATTAALAGALLTLTAAPAGAVPETLGLTARVTDGGVPIAGARTFAIRIFDAPSGGTALWTESDIATPADGIVYLTLGDQDALDAEVLDGGPLWIELQVDGTVLSPRLAITSAPYAVRAGVAETAEHADDAALLAGQPASSFAAAGHDHAGAYLPVGAALACTGTDKVTAIAPSGSVVCGPDTDTSATYTAGTGLQLLGNAFAVAFAGSGVASTVARSDHNHAGTYLPLSSNLTCPAGMKVAAINGASGAVTCTTDLDTNTTYSAGTGLILNGTTFSVSQFACPFGFLTHRFGSSVLCSRKVQMPPFSGLVWREAARECRTSHGGRLCRYDDLFVAFMPSTATHTQQAYGIAHWMGDHTGDGEALITWGTDMNDFDATSSDATSHQGYYCCTEGRF